MQETTLEIDGVFCVVLPGGRTIVPAHSERFWGERHPQGPAIQLGHVSCLGRTTRLAGRPRAEGFRVTALYPDGSRATVDGGEVPPTPDVELSATDPGTPRSLPFVMASAPEPPWLPLGGGLLALLLIGGLGWRVRARIRPMP